MRPLNQTIGREREQKVSAPNRHNTGHCEMEVWRASVTYTADTICLQEVKSMMRDSRNLDGRCLLSIALPGLLRGAINWSGFDVCFTRRSRALLIETNEVGGRVLVPPLAIGDISPRRRLLASK